MGVYLVDRKKAFDTVDHGILLKKFNHIGIRGLWSKSYLHDSAQYVVYNGIKSETLPVILGIPQVPYWVPPFHTMCL